MATVTKGRTFTSGETVTPTKLNDLVDLATVTNIQAADIASNAVTTAKIADAAVTNAKLGNDIVLVPAGAVLPFAMNSAPTGWLAANGDAVSRSTYATLFAAIGTTHGVGNGSTTFNLPDLRGIFVRGSGSQTISGITYNKTFAAKEGDAMQGHAHNYSRFNTNQPFGGNVASASFSLTPQNVTDQTTTPVTDGTNGTPRTGSETRPANIALLYCIKF